MNQDRVDEIRISKHLLRIAHQTYPLANIARVQAVWLEWSRKLATFQEVIGFLLLLLVLGFIPQILGRSAAGLSGLFWLAAAVAVGVVLFRLVNKRRRFVLAVETSGGQSAVLTAKNDTELRMLEHEILAAIEDPPIEPRSIHLHNVEYGDTVFGDKIAGNSYQQGGSGNVMNVKN